ncbi:MAG: ABC transporter permease subunit, partial [Mycoplasma sp.]|nr:ABC transporter permease subunit [Mycoplasma sp.]
NDELIKLNEIDNKLIKQNDYFFLKQHYHSALKIYFILDYLFKIKDENFKKLLTRIAKYQFLFYWQLNYKEILKKDPTYKYISYNLISKNTNFYFIKIQESLTKFKYVHKDQYLSHISETYEKVRLSDLPPLNFKTIIMLLINYAILAFWAFIILTPIIQIIILSFESTKVGYLNEKYNPERKDLPFYQHYKILFKDTAFLDWLKNSLGVAIFTTIIVISITTILAYSFSRFRFRGRKTSIMIIMLLQMIPTVTALTSFFVIYNIFTDVFKTSMNIFLVIIYAGGGITGNTFILRGYFNSISQDIDQAAKVDGASNIKTFFTILIPIAKPMIALVALWSFIGPFGDVVLPALLFDGRRESVKHLTMAAGLNTLAGSHQFAYLAGAIITSIPITIGFIIGQSFLVSGLTSGAVK